MKWSLCCFITFIFSACTASSLSGKAGDVTLPERLSVLERELVLRENRASGNSKGFVAEYIPETESFDNWTWMFATRFIVGTDLQPKASAIATAQKVISSRHAGDPVADARVIETDDGKSVFVDFLVSANNASVVEHNVWRFFKAPKGLVSFQIAHRSHSTISSAEQMKNFIQQVPHYRNKMLLEIMRTDLPIIKYAEG